MFKIESYVTPILLSYVDKYVKDFKPADAQVSLWGGGVVLHNLVLKADVLQQEVALPFTLVSGRIHELLIQVPWTKIMSEPIVVTIDTIECVLSLTQPATAVSEEESLQELPSRKTQVVEAPPGYMQALVRRIVSNIALRVHHLIVKYVQDDIVMSLNVKHLAVDSAGPDWAPSFADIDPGDPVIRRLMRLDNLTLCLDQADADGKIRFYQEPLLYRCQLDLRVLTRLVSATRRRASSLSIELRSSKLAWGVTGDQLTLLLRLFRERPGLVRRSPTPAPRPNTSQTVPLHATSVNSAEPARSESWSEWAWSWLPTWSDRDGELEEASTPPSPVPVHFAAYFDDVSFVFKVMETDSSRKRSRAVLELNASQTVIKSSICSPVMIRVRGGVRSLSLLSRGKCVCAHLGYDGAMDEPTFYLRKKQTDEPEDDWEWPNDQLSQAVDSVRDEDEGNKVTPDLQDQPDYGQPEEPAPDPKVPKDDTDEFWQKMAPQFYIEFIHERSPPSANTNPYDKPPTDFQYSDWVEECDMKIQLAPVEVRVCMGLLHRLMCLRDIFAELPHVADPELPMRTLTVEECEALSDNLPQQRITIEARGFNVQVHPYDHSMAERPSPSPLVLDLDLPKISVVITGPLYPHRVCSAACQMPDDSGTLWQGARLHVTLDVNTVQAKICSTFTNEARPCARADIRAVAHVLLNKDYFTRRESVILGYSVQIREVNVCGSAARLQAAWQVLASLLERRASAALAASTLAADALHDEEAVAIDLTYEGLAARGYLTKNTNTHIVNLQSMKATALQEENGCGLQQAWLFSAPDTPANTPCFRLAVQWCKEALANSLDYAGVWTEPIAIAVDPLLIAWLAYKPTLKPLDSTVSMTVLKGMSSQYLLHRRTTPTSSSGRGASRSGSGAEVHARARSAGSSDKIGRDAQRTTKQALSPLDRLWSSTSLVSMHERIRRMVLNVELGLTMVYVTTTTASAVDCATVRDAMERHASVSQAVVALSLGRLTMLSNSLTKQFWQEVNHDGPTFLVSKAGLDPNQPQSLPNSFPWKFRIADVSCYTLEGSASAERRRDSGASGLRSQLKTACLATPRTVLEVVTMTVTLSVVTKSLHIVKRAAKKETKKEKEPTFEEERFKYFTKGMNFKPTTLKEFVRGPAKRKKSRSPELTKAEPKADTVTTGPVVSLGIHIHADTPPLIIRLEQDQVHVIAATLHCFTHMLALHQRPELHTRRRSSTSMALGTPRSFIRSASHMDDLNSSSEDATSESKSELISIFEARPVLDSLKIKTFFWFQWVVSRVTVVAASDQVKLTFDVDDIISTVDVQTQYNQLKIMVASASVRHYTRTGSDEWTAGVLGGRVLEAREPSNAQEENHFLTITVTQARISNLPASWREELHPKLLEDKNMSDTMWEIYATLAPLEVVIQPQILEKVVSLVLEMAPRSFCTLAKETKNYTPSNWQRPFLYITAGGLRLLLTVEGGDKNADDTFMFVIGKLSVNPHPDNPMYRRAVNVCDLNIEGRQYEVSIKNVSIRSAQLQQLASQESSDADMMKGTARENPALKWTQQVVSPSITPVLHNVDIGCVVAPALYLNGVLTYGPAVELNLTSDCVIELSLDQLAMAQRVSENILNAIRNSENEPLLFNEAEHGICPFATLLSPQRDNVNATPPPAVSAAPVTDDILKDRTNLRQSAGTDSGVDTATTSTAKQPGRQTDETSPLASTKKSVSVAFTEQETNESEFLEVFVTMGVIELSLYVADDGSPDIVALRPPDSWVQRTPPEPPTKVVIKEEQNSSSGSHHTPPLHTESAISLTECIRNADIGKIKLEQNNTFPHARKTEGNLPLLHVTLFQPNLYYWRKKTQTNIQVSLFNAWVGLGAGQAQDLWHAVLLSTAKGAVDPITDIPPALATMKLVVPCSAPTAGGPPPVRGTLRLDVERPVLVELTADLLQRLMRISTLISSRTISTPVHKKPSSSDSPLLYSLRRFLEQQCIESITVQTTQIGVSGPVASAGLDSATLQLAVGGRPVRLAAQALISSLVASAGTLGVPGRVVLQPLMLGIELEASWEAWRRAEGGMTARQPSVRVCCDLDSVTLDLRPENLAVIAGVADTLEHLFNTDNSAVDTVNKESVDMPTSSFLISQEVAFERHPSQNSVEDDEQFYKDDLRSGAFKIVGSGLLPMAYQVTLHNNAVSWRYPHPRAITRLLTYPLPGQDEETACVLEVFNQLLSRWEPHTHFCVPVGEPRELQLYVPSPDAVFAVMWRFRVFEGSAHEPPFAFDINKFMPRPDLLDSETDPEPTLRKPACGVTPEQLSGVVRVDSCFAPRLTPPLRIATRVARLAIYFHNELPSTSSESRSIEGYYVSKALRRAHRVVSLQAVDATLHSHLGSPAGALLLLDTSMSSDIIDCATNTMEELIGEFRMRAGVSLPNTAKSRARVAMTRVHVALNIPRLRTLQALAEDWQAAVQLHMHKIKNSSNKPPTPVSTKDDNEAEVVAESLAGRVSLWLHNGTGSALRVGQDDTEEMVPLAPGLRLAYRWQSPTASKRLRFALGGSETTWNWSTSIPFTTEHYRVRLHDAESLGGSKNSPAGGVFLYTRVEEVAGRRCLHVEGRLRLANMLRYSLLYKVRGRCPDFNQWRTLNAGVLEAEAIGRSIACGADCEMTLKIKFTTNDTGWSGDIPLKECPKENVPWLVKVPSEGETAYVSVWCRVVRARSDGRILATVWPLYVLYSHLPLDTDVLIVTESVTSSTDVNFSPPSLVQPAPGRGACTHLLVPGTTAVRHYLSFQYREIDCPVTKEAVPLHYGVTDTSVFDKRAPMATLDDVLADTLRWMKRMGRDAESAWPYSTVATHWPGAWEAAMLQPRCDVTVRYSAVAAGGGCSLLVTLCPAVLLCNAAPMALTLRAHDAAPLCKLEPGSAISPPSVVLKKPFFISVEMGRETFVSGELVLSTDDIGRYGQPAPGRVVLDRGTELAVQCNQKVALLTMYYEIKKDINVLGLSSMYVLINRLDRNVLVSAMAVPNETDNFMTLRPGVFKTIEPSAENDVHGKSLCNFWVVGHMWRGSNPADLRLYLCLALAGGEASAAPVRLGRPPTRRAVALVDSHYNSLPVVVTQVKHEGRWVVTVALDPCPQLAVHNRTTAPIAVAQPVHSTDDPITSNTTVMAECAGTAWHCLVPPGALMHYSTPVHCLRYPAPHNAAPHPPIIFLSFAKPFQDETDLLWCAPVVVAEGEQLVQLYTGTVKMRVRTHLHSTLLELRDVDHRDISASDIRNRLSENFSTEDISAISSYGKATKTDGTHIQLERTDADSKLLAEPDGQSNGIGRSASQETTTTLVPNIRNQEADVQEFIKFGAKQTTKAVKIPESYSFQEPGRIIASTNNPDPSTVELYIAGRNSIDAGRRSSKAKLYSDESSDSGKAEPTTALPNVSDNEWDETASWSACDRLRLLASSVAVELSAAPFECPLIALHLDHAVALIKSDARRTKTTVSIADVQVDNPQYSSGQFDFAVVATTRNAPLPAAPLPPLWNVFGERRAFGARPRLARALLRLTHDTWTIAHQTYTQLAEVEMRVGPLALYVEDAYVVALGALFRSAVPPRAASPPLLSDERSLRTPLRLRTLTIYPLDLTLTLHTAVRMYIALDQSPLRLTAFKLDNAMTSTEQLTHALTVHYLSAAILGAGWVVGGLELLGAPGALAARVGGATGGVRGVAAAAAAALLRSLSAWAGSLARNLDLLAGDEEHARRAAAARRRAPPSLLAGLAAGITNFAINILGAVGGLAHHPLVGVAVGETESSTTALRRGLVGALTKPLSATADLVAYAGHGLLSQTGWDPVPQPRARRDSADGERSSGWRRDCVRWTFRLAGIPTLTGFHVLLDDVQRSLLITHKFLIVADPYTERSVEMIAFENCSISPYQGQIIEIVVERPQTEDYIHTTLYEDDDEIQISAAAMARVARYTGADAGAFAGKEPRVLALLPAPGEALALYAALVTAAHNNSDAHFPLLGLHKPLG